jgi:hypothetical protein
VAAPLGTADELVRLIVARASSAADAGATPVLVGSNASH